MFGSLLPCPKYIRMLTVRRASRSVWMLPALEVPNSTVMLCPRKDRPTAEPVVPCRVTLCSSGTAVTTFEMIIEAVTTNAQS